MNRVPASRIRQQVRCEWLPDGCFYDGSGLNGEPVMQRFIREGMDAVWDELETYYRQLAHDAPVEGQVVDSPPALPADGAQ